MTQASRANIIRGDVSEKHDPSTAIEEPVHRAAGAYLSALLIAVALMFLVVMARPRSTAPAAQAVLPTAARTAEPTLTARTRPSATPGPIYVYVAGEVRRPDVYALPMGSRVKQAVDRAGGMTARADRVAINLAAPLADGQQITVPARGQRQTVSPSTVATPTRATDTASPAVEGLVNLNTATQAELETLPGIGPSKAAAIIAYREEKGPFRRVETVQDVPGIGPKIWEQLRDKVTV